MTSPSVIHVIARHRARPECIREVRAILTGLIAPTRAEPGCVKYELFQSASDPTDFVFVETFANEAALRSHAAAPYITGVGTQLRDFIAKPAEVTTYRQIG